MSKLSKKVNLFTEYCNDPTIGSYNYYIRKKNSLCPEHPVCLRHLTHKISIANCNKFTPV